MTKWNRVVISALPSETAVELADAKKFLEVDYNDHDDLIKAVLESAIAEFDGPNGCGIALFTQSWKYSLHVFPSWQMRLPGWPVKSITSIKYVGMDGVEQTIPSGDCHLDLGGDEAILEPAFGKSWPVARNQSGAIVIEYVLGNALADIPIDLSQAIKSIVALRYDYRSEGTEKDLKKLPFGAQRVMAKYRRGGITA